jgi:hypothetical protein
MKLDELIHFGIEAEQLKYPAIGEGGYIVPGGSPSSIYTQDSQGDCHEGPARAGTQEARPAAGQGQGPPGEAAAAGSPAHALDGRLGRELHLDELLEYHPRARISSSRHGFSHVSFPVELFRSLAYRAHLLLEVPHGLPLALPRQLTAQQSYPSSVPAIRAWATTPDGVHIRAHHEYPDASICACKPGEWVWGVDPIWVYADWCISWIAKSLHLQLLGFWPGKQHYPAAQRLRRDMPDEYCGCGSARRYGVCCRAEDLAIPEYHRLRDHHLASQNYFDELRFQRRPSSPFRSGVAPLTPRW